MGCVSLMRAASPQKLSLTLALSTAYQSALGAVLRTLFHFSGTRACVALAAAVLGIEVAALYNDLFQFGTELVHADATHKLGPWQALKAYLYRCWKV
jgi:hypothetical protein